MSVSLSQGIPPSEEANSAATVEERKNILSKSASNRVLTGGNNTSYSAPTSPVKESKIKKKDKMNKSSEFSRSPESAGASLAMFLRHDSQSKKVKDQLKKRSNSFTVTSTSPPSIEQARSASLAAYPLKTKSSLNKSKEVLIVETEKPKEEKKEKEREEKKEKEREDKKEKESKVEAEEHKDDREAAENQKINRRGFSFSRKARSKTEISKADFNISAIDLNENNDKSSAVVFGVDLDILLKKEHRESLGVPLLVEKCTKWILENGTQIEGLFRVSPNHKDMKDIMKMFDEGKPVDFTELKVDIHVVCAVLKQYLGQLPEPVLPFHTYTCFIAVYGVVAKVEEEDLITKIQSVVDMMPKSHILLLSHLLTFLHQVSQHEEKNRMSAKNLATVFGPIILRSEEQFNEELLGEFSAVNNIMELLITYNKKIIPF